MSHMISDSELEAAMSGLPGWFVESDELCKDYAFDSFRETVSAVVRLSFEAEEINHHPDIRISYNKLEIRMCSHDAGNKITHKDVRLAGLIEKAVKGL